MTVREQLMKVVEDTRFSQDQITSHVQRIHDGVLAESPHLDNANFTAFHSEDLERLLEEYDRLFFKDLCRKMLGKTELSFRISRRMSRAGGKTIRFVHRNGSKSVSYEIAVSSTLLFQTFHDVERTVTVTGLECQNRLEALQRIFEHELIHLVELLLWDRSSCSKNRFQSMASRFFGHTDHRHQLVTPKERALTKHGIKPGSRVRFRFDGTEHVGMVNRITKRATVLVEDRQGPKYSDGKRYAKFYVPIGILEPLE